MTSFSKNSLALFSRQMMVDEIGYAGQEKINKAKVLVIGAGGLGCPVLQYLSACGVGTIGIVDFDKIEIHNLHRQILYGIEDVGKQKVIVAKEKLTHAYPHIQIHSFNELLSEQNAETIISQFDLVVDGTDNFHTRYLVNDACVKTNKPLVYGSILNFEGQLSVFNVEGSKHLRDIFPDPPDAEDVPNCDENGVLGALPATIGSMMALETLKLILGLPVLTNQLLIIETLNWNIRKLNF
ncbi:MAG: HesA/MoeB/ThiF family protein [Bacteroidota bacterium]